MASGYREVRFPTIVFSALARNSILISIPVFKERAALHYAHSKLRTARNAAQRLDQMAS